MTTIALYEGWLVADGRFTDEGEILDDNCDKFLRREDGLITTGAGDGAPIEHFMRGDFWKDVPWLPGGGPDISREYLKHFKDTTCWVYRPGDKHVFQSTKAGFDPLPIRNARPQAIGSGASYFKGALTTLLMYRDALGMSNRQMILAAMEVAKENDLYTGGRVTLTRLK